MWIQTYTGKRIDPTNPKIEEIDIIDIAHALSNLCRYTGHCSQFYSVAEHSVIGTLQFPDYIKSRPFVCQNTSDEYIRKMQKQFLLHDASEAYFNDIARPVKPNLPGYKKLEKNLEQIIFRKFNLDYLFYFYVKEMDNIMLYNESQYLFSDTKDWDFTEQDKYLIRKENFNFYLPKDANILYLETFLKLFNKGD